MSPTDRARDIPDEPDGIDLSWDVPLQAHVPGAVLVIIMAVAWIAHIRSGGMGHWGVSGAAIADGRYRTIILHMVAHGGAVHIAMNAAAMAAISGPLVARMGHAPLAWLRYLLLFLMSGLAGAAVYVGLHPHGLVPMVGASGAIYGLLGLLVRLPRQGETLMPILSSRTKAIAIGLIKANAWLLVVFAILPLVFGQSGGLAWEAHLGGFLFGLLAGPSFLPRGVRDGTSPD
jgi:membrane associated rhomboid family serine protease